MANEKGLTHNWQAFGDFGIETSEPGDGFTYIKVPSTKDKGRPSSSGKMVLTGSSAGFQTVPGSNGFRINLSAGFTAGK